MGVLPDVPDAETTLAAMETAGYEGTELGPPGYLGDTDTLRDHWTVVTRDGLPSVHVEHTLALTKEGVYVVTADEETLIPR